jgi:hypothetical protein
MASHSFQNKNFVVEKKEGSSSINLLFKKPCKEFLQSLAKLEYFSAPSLDTSFTRMDFLGSSILTLQQFTEKLYLENGSSKMSYNTVGRLIWCLMRQQELLEKAGLAFFSLAFEDILVVDEWNFFCANPGLCLPISSKGTIVFNSPFERNKFSSPELIAISKIPSSVSVKTFYYSLASLAFFCFFRKHYSYSYSKTSLDSESGFNFEIYNCLQSILGTKMHWFFKRALENDVDKRMLLFI